MRLHVGFSVDGLKWDIREEDFKLVGADPEIAEWVYGYDPRVTKIGDRYYVTWCNGYPGSFPVINPEEVVSVSLSKPETDVICGAVKSATIVIVLFVELREDVMQYLSDNRDHRELWKGVPISRDGKVDRKAHV